MRRTLAFLVLIALAAISNGCSSSDQGSAPNANAPGTTTYNSSVPKTTAATPATDGANSVTNTSNSGSGGAAPKTSPNKPGIKPPTE